LGLSAVITLAITSALQRSTTRQNAFPPKILGKGLSKNVKDGFSDGARQAN